MVSQVRSVLCITKQVTKATTNDVVSSLFNQIDDQKDTFSCKQHSIVTYLLNFVNVTVSNKIRIICHNIYNYKRKHTCQSIMSTDIVSMYELTAIYFLEIEITDK